MTGPSGRPDKERAIGTNVQVTTHSHDWLNYPDMGDWEMGIMIVLELLKGHIYLLAIV